MIEMSQMKRSQQKLSKIAEEKKKTAVHPRLSIVDMTNDNSKRNRTDENHLQEMMAKNFPNVLTLSRKINLSEHK